MSNDHNITVYHNPKCSHSRSVLALLAERGIEATVVEYLETPPSRDTLREIAAAMGGSVRALLRQAGTPYDELQLGDAKWTEDELMDFIAQHPILIQRPLVVTPRGTRICRPAEGVLELID